MQSNRPMQNNFDSASFSLCLCVGSPWDMFILNILYTTQTFYKYSNNVTWQGLKASFFIKNKIQISPSDYTNLQKVSCGTKML